MNEAAKKHNITLIDRTLLTVSGANDLIGFDETIVTLNINGSILSITGEDLCVTKLNLENGEVVIKGTIDALVYSVEEQKKPLFSKLFK